MEANDPTLKIIRLKEDEHNLLVSSRAIHYRTVIIRKCQFNEYLYNFSLVAANITTISLNVTHSQSECAANISWNTGATKIRMQAEFVYTMGSDPSIWLRVTRTSTAIDFTEAVGILLDTFKFNNS